MVLITSIQFAFLPRLVTQHFQCDLCANSCGASSSLIKHHYHLLPNLTIKVSSESGLLSPQKKYVDMEDRDDNDGKDENNEENNSMRIDTPLCLL